ncbi:protein O-mannosyl-transferase [Gammaproteobacteria bacterium]
MQDRWREITGLGLLLLFVALLYVPGLSGIFMFDDEQNITNQPAIQIDSLSYDNLAQAAFSSDAGILKRPVSMLSFAVNAYLTGINPYPFKAVNLLIHILNGILIYWVTKLLLKIHRTIHGSALSSELPIAFAITAAWMLHPINLSTVLYVVQRMTGLSVLFSLLGMVWYLLGRFRQIEGHPGMVPILFSFLLAWPLAILSKENGALLPAFLLVLEGTILRLHGLEGKTRKYVLVLFIATVGFPFLVGSLYLGTHPEVILNGYGIRSFTLGERLLTEARVLWMYLGLIASPSVSRLGLYHDDIPISHSLLDPVTTLWAIFGIIGLFAAGIMSRRRFPWISFGIFFFLVGHVMESTFISLEIAHEHRNYLPSYGILAAVFFSLLQPIPRIEIYRLQKAVAVVLILGFALVTGLRANLWGNPAEYLLTDVQYHSQSPRANYEAGRFLLASCIKSIDNEVRKKLCGKAKSLFLKSYENDSQFIAGLLAAIRTEDVLGQSPLPEKISSLHHALATEKMSLLTPSALIALGQCLFDNSCQFSNVFFDDLYAMALSNPTLDKRSAATLYNERAVLAIQTGDLQKTTQYIQSGVEADPDNAQIRINLTYLLLMQGNLEAAEKEIVRLQKNWIAPSLKKRLLTYKEEVEEARKKQNP